MLPSLISDAENIEKFIISYCFMLCVINIKFSSIADVLLFRNISLKTKN